MGQLHLYVDRATEERLRQRAEAEGLSLSSYLAKIIRKEIGGSWPPGYFQTVVGGWRGEPLQRAEQGKLEERRKL